MKMTQREKLLYKWTFATFLEKARALEKEKGLINRNWVIKLQILFAEREGKCAYCGATENLTADHIFPVVFLKMLGYPADKMFREEWYQCLCKPCNFKKQNKVDWENPRTIEILKKAIEEKPTWEYEVLHREEAKQKAKRFAVLERYA